MSAKTGQQERKQTLMLSGQQGTITVVHDALVIREGKQILHTLQRGEPDVKTIILLSQASYTLSLDAFSWCSQEGISIRLQSPDGLHLWALTTNVCESVDLKKE